jgi:hypothetical protein
MISMNFPAGALKIPEKKFGLNGSSLLVYIFLEKGTELDEVA